MDEAARIAELAAASGQASGAAQHLADLLLQAAKATGSNATAATASANELSKLSSRADSVRSGLQSLAGVGSGLVNSFVGVSSSVYGADKAFTSVLPALDSMHSTITGLVTALGQMGSGTSIFGVSLGKASEGLAQLTNMGFDVLVKALKFQIEAAQKVSDSYFRLSAIGATFGGSIDEMARHAAGTRTPIEEFSKAISANAESISKLGLGMTRGASVVVGMAKDIYDVNDSLVGLYGNLTELSKGTADFLALQTQLGIDVESDYHNQLKYAQEYLMRQKELSAITGKTAETMKREEEGRRKQLDYNLKLGRLGEVAKANVQEGMSMAGKIFGDQGAKYAEEYFATGGKVYSAEALRYQAMNQEAADTIGQFMSGVDTDRDTYRKNNGKYLKDNASALEGWAKSLEDMAEINRNAQNPLIKAQTETASAILENLTLIKQSTDIFAQMASDRKKAEEGLDPLSKVYVDAERGRSKVQREIDAVVTENMKGLGTAMVTLQNITLAQVQAMGDTNKVLAAFRSGLEGAANWAGSLADDYDKKLREAIRRNETGRPTTPATSVPAPSANGTNTSAATPVVDSNGTVVGTVSPTANQVDMTPVVHAMHEQTELTKDVIAQLKDNNDLVKKLIDYTA